ncbi:MAG: hypothetical protein M1818_000279 [Claussenomyces sp. TS43310]|nr:MAG: hypothetical protein M1818_000279 [Claussenomyces sp. TS43310]
MQKWTVTEPYLNIHCGLGEAPYHEAVHNRLRFVDIKKKQLHVIDLDVGPSSLHTVQLDMPVGVTADIEGFDSRDKILVGGKHGIAVLDRRTESYEYLNRFYDSREQDDRLRSNDGAVDPQGRFWIGTMNDFHVGAPQAEGTMFRFDGDLTRNTIKTGLTIPNGIGWSRDRQTMYFTHSTEKTIFQYDFDAETGVISNERVFYQHEGEGDPDGFKMDAEGNIWQSIYGEGRVLKISPEGRVIGQVDFPTRCMTCPAFVGEELWVTSAEEEEPERYPESAKNGGALFRVKVGVKGLQDFKFKLRAEPKGL